MSRRVSIFRIPHFGLRDLTLALRSPYEREGRDKRRRGQGDLVVPDSNDFVTFP